MIAFLFALLLQLAHLAPAPPVAAAPPPPAPAATVRAPGRVAPPLPGASSLDNSAQSHPAENGGTVPAPAAGRGTDAPRPVTPPPAAPPAMCEAGQTPARDGCAQGQLPDETTGRELG